MSQGNYNEHSHDSVLTRVLLRLDAQDKILIEIRDQTRITNGRVSTLEREKWYQRGFVAAIGIAIAAIWQWWINQK